jgi:hypothetical protein
MFGKPDVFPPIEIVKAREKRTREIDWAGRAAAGDLERPVLTLAVAGSQRGSAVP